MPRVSAFTFGFLLLTISACGSADDVAPPDTTTATTTTIAPTTTTATTSTTTTTEPPPETTTIPSTTSVAALAIEALVVWDGTACSYEGPETAPVGSVISVSFRNDGDFLADLEIDYLARGVTLEEGIAAWPAEARSAEDYPGNTYPVAFLPEYPQSVDPGGEVSADVTLVTARPHTFICFEGGAGSVVQSIRLAPTGLTATDS